MYIESFLVSSDSFWGPKKYLNPWLIKIISIDAYLSVFRRKDEWKMRMLHSFLYERKNMNVTLTLHHVWKHYTYYIIM